MYGPLTSILSEAVLPARLLIGLVAATVAAEGGHEDDEVEGRLRRGTDARGESKGDGSVRGASFGSECGMVMALSLALCDSKSRGGAQGTPFCVCSWIGLSDTTERGGETPSALCCRLGCVVSMSRQNRAGPCRY